MKLQVKVHANARKNAVEVLPDGSLKVNVSAPAVDGKANAKMIEVLASHYGVPRGHIQIVRGIRSSRKLVEVQSE